MKLTLKLKAPLNLSDLSGVSLSRDIDIIEAIENGLVICDKEGICKKTLKKMISKPKTWAKDNSYRYPVCSAIIIDNND